jgi:hypothetical protein
MGMSGIGRTVVQWSAVIAMLASTRAATAQHPPPPPAAPRTAPETSWQRRFELERPSMLRYFPEYGVPPGYEYETQYDSYLLVMGSVEAGLGYGLSCVASAAAETNWLGYVPILGPFVYVATVDDDNAGYYMILALPGAIFQVTGLIQLSIAFAHSKPVLVRTASKEPSNARISLRPLPEGARLDAEIRF